MALGAGAKQVLAQVMRETLLIVGVGVIFGAVGSYLATNIISAAWFGINDRPSMLFGAGPHDPFSITLATLPFSRGRSRRLLTGATCSASRSFEALRYE